MTVVNHELIAIQTECREQLLAQLKANGLTPFEFYAWTMARDMETEASDCGHSVEVSFTEELNTRMDDASSFERQLMSEVQGQLVAMGHHFNTRIGY